MNEAPDPGVSAASAWPWLAALLQEQETTETVGEYRHAFRIGPHWLLIPAGLPAEVYPPLPCSRLPFTHAWCLGLASFRGDLAPVFDLGALLLDRGAEPGRYFLLLGRRDACAALCIDEIAGVPVPPDTPTTPVPPLPGLPGELACNALHVGGQDYIELQIPHLLGGLAARACLLEAGTFQSQD